MEKYLTLTLTEFLADDNLNNLKYIEIYNYVEQITRGFDYERTCTVWMDVRDYCGNRINKLSYETYIENGWDIPCFSHGIPKFEEMRKNANVGILSIPQYRVVTLIENKIKQIATNAKQIATNAKKQPQQIIIPPEILQELEQSGCITQSPLKWLKSKQLLGYFVEVMNDKYNLKHGQKRTIKPFEDMFGITGITSAISDYKKIGVLPVGYKIIDSILK